MAGCSPSSTLLTKVCLGAALCWVAGLVLLTPATAHAQCGSYVVMLDENGQPIIDPLHAGAMSEGSASFLNDGLPSGPSEGSGDRPCNGPGCRQDKSLPLLPPWSREVRSVNDQATLDRLGSDAEVERNVWPQPSSVAPLSGEPSALERPPRAL